MSDMQSVWARRIATIFFARCARATMSVAALSVMPCERGVECETRWWWTNLSYATREVMSGTGTVEVEEEKEAPFWFELELGNLSTDGLSFETGTHCPRFHFRPDSRASLLLLPPYMLSVCFRSMLHAP